jgi:hypothetical protein
MFNKEVKEWNCVVLSTVHEKEKQAFLKYERRNIDLIHSFGTT